MADKKIADLDPMDTGDLLAAAVFEVQNVGGATPESRKLTKTQMSSIFGGGGGGSRVPFVYDTDSTHTVSAGVTRIDIECWGAGGGGAGEDGGKRGAAGGGGYAMTCNLTVAEDDELAVTVGVGGVWDTPTGNPGGDSLVEDSGMIVLCEASGGEGGAAGAAVNGGSGVTGDIQIGGAPAMGNMTASLLTTGGAAGGGGGLGGVYLNGAGSTNATQPGGGGASEQDGADGRVIIWEYQS